MPKPFGLPGPRSAVLALAVLLGTADRAAPSTPSAFGPLQAGRVFTRSATLGRPWIPSGIEFAAKGELLFTSNAGPRAHFELLSSGARLARRRLLAGARSSVGATGSMDVVARGDALFSLTQRPDPDPSRLRTRVARRDPTDSLRELWVHDLPVAGDGPARIAVAKDGARVVVAALDRGAATVHVEFLGGADGSVARSLSLPAPNLRRLSISADGGVVALSAGLSVFLFDGGGNALQTLSLPLSTEALALSGDGRWLYAGGAGELLVFENTGGAFVLRRQVPAAPHEMAVRVDASHDGGTVAVGWWNAATTQEIRFEVMDGPSGAVLHDERIGGTGFQNLPREVLVTPDGRRAAIASWGNGGPEPEVLLFDRAGGGILFRIDLPGSATDIALDDSGSRLAVSLKHGHANQFATTGEIRLYDTGERELAVIGQPLAGGVLRLAAERAGSRRVLFLVGRLADVGGALSGVQGELLLERTGLSVHGVTADGEGLARLALGAAERPSGPVAVQAIFRGPFGLALSNEAVEPWIAGP